LIHNLIQPFALLEADDPTSGKELTAFRAIGDQTSESR
jgi:hypothetical protein